MVGSQLSWTNNQEGDNRIESNIDRSFANIRWFSEYPSVRAARGVSDHCPQLLRFDIPEERRGLFKFYNVIADHDQFEDIVRSTWRHVSRGDLLRGVWENCTRLKGPLKKLNTKWFANTSARVESIRQELKRTQQELQTGYREAGYQEEKILLAELEKWSAIEERIWCQKARVDWLKLGDSNTKFFHAYTKMRRNTNAIHRLIRSDGSVCMGQEMIKLEILDFYKELMGSATDELITVDKRVVAKGPTLNMGQQRMLCADCTEHEVKTALLSMDSNKAPRWDGFNVYFFKKSWHIIGKDVVQAIYSSSFTLGYCLLR